MPPPRRAVTLAWALQLTANTLAGAAPAYGFNIVTGTQRGQTLQFAASTVLYLALAASKSAFITTLLRLAVPRRLRLALWTLLAAFSAASAAMGVVTWLELCDYAPHAMLAPVGGGGVCISFDVLRWVHTGYALFLVAIDVFLAAVPWVVVSAVFLPAHEKAGVGAAMSVVGLAGVACVARVVIMAGLPVAEPGGVVPDWTCELGFIPEALLPALLQIKLIMFVCGRRLRHDPVHLTGRGRHLHRRAGAADDPRHAAGVVRGEHGGWW